MTISSPEFLQPVCSLLLLWEKNNGQKGESYGRQAVQFLAKFTLDAWAECQSLLLTWH